MHVDALAIYPIKGTQAVPLEVAELRARGFAGDRRWMLVDDHNRFITQREEPRLATLGATLSETSVLIALPGGEALHIARPSGSSRVMVKVWKSTVDAAIADEEVNERLSQFFERKVKLVFMDDRASRFANPKWAGTEKPVSFADGYPILLTSTASLHALNEVIKGQGGVSVSMDRFRANLVVDNLVPWDEDSWAVIQVGDLIFDVVKPCIRCIVPTQDQKTGVVRADNQPTRALKSIRFSADQRAKGVLFGWNIIARTEGTISLGDEVTVVERRPAWAIKPDQSAS